MHEKKITYFFIVVLLSCYIFTGCQSTMVSDVSERTREYRELESSIRDGETELAITGAKLESAGEELEHSISESEEIEQRLGELLQLIGTRKLPENIADELRNKYPEIFSQ